MDVKAEIALEEAISERVCKPGHTYNSTTKRCYPVVGTSGGGKGGGKGSADAAIAMESYARQSQGVSK